MAVVRSDAFWTYEDLLALPDDGKRYEIIDGALFEMTGPNRLHAQALMNLILWLGPIVRGLGGAIFAAPFDVFFPGADPVEPDLLVMLPGGGAVVSDRGVEGAPDLVVEVISPSHRSHDTLTKRALYGRGGVREYWIVDPAARTLEIFTLDRDALHSIRVWSDDETAASPLLDRGIPLFEVFAGID